MKNFIYIKDMSHGSDSSSSNTDSEDEQDSSLAEDFIESLRGTKSDITINIYNFINLLIINQHIQSSIKESALQMVISKLIYDEPIDPEQAAKISNDYNLYQQFIDLDMYSETYYICYNILRPDSDIEPLIILLVMILGDEEMKPIYKNTICQIIIYRCVHGEVIAPLELLTVDSNQQHNDFIQDSVSKIQVYELVYDNLISSLENNKYADAEIALIKLSEENFSS